MELFGVNFLRVRNMHLLPKIKYGIKRNKHQYWFLKDVFTQKLLSLNKLSGKSFEIELSKEDYYKAIHCDIELFMNKITLQYSDFEKQNNTSPTWSFVTFYYFAFFNATCLFRYIDRGFIFLSQEHIKRLQNYYLATTSDIISFDAGNYYFAYKEINNYGNVVLTVSFKVDSVHKSTWLQLEATLREFTQYAKDEEKVILEFFIKHFNAFKSEYPSNLRNKLNYNGDSTILDFENKLPYVSIQSVDRIFLKYLAELDISQIENVNQIKSIGYLSSYLFEFNLRLYKEFERRSDYGKDFLKERDNYLKQRRVMFPVLQKIY